MTVPLFVTFLTKILIFYFTDTSLLVQQVIRLWNTSEKLYPK